MRYRYRTDEELKDSGVEWIGKIPKDYKLEPLKKYFMFEKGRNAGIYTAEYVGKNEGEYPVYSGQTENEGIMGLIDSYEYDLRQCLFTTTVGAKVMTVLYLTGKFTLSQNCLIMINNMNNVCTKYAYYYLQELFRYEKSLIPLYMQPSLRIEDLKRYKILIQNLREQEKIANFLDKKTSQFDSIISKKEKLIEKLEEAKKSIISEVVTGKVKVVKNDDGYELVKRKSDEMKDSGVEWLGDIPKDWAVKKFKYIFSLNKGLSITKVDLKEEGIPCVNYGEIHSRYRFELKPSIHKLKYVDELYLKYNTTSLLSYGDFIFCDTSEDIDGCGNFTCLNENSSIFAGYHTIIAKALKQINFRYMSYSFDSNSWRMQIRTRVSGVKVFSITQTILKETNIIMPYLLEQENIVKYLDVKCNEINSSICKIKLQIEKLKEAKQSLISEVVTGKIEILD